MEVSAFFSDLDNVVLRLRLLCDVDGSLPNVLFISSAPEEKSPKPTGLLSGEDGREGGGVPSGLLQGVAVGVKLRSLLGVVMQDGVTAFIPRSFNILARPRVVENVEVELRLERVRGVFIPGEN